MYQGKIHAFTLTNAQKQLFLPCIFTYIHPDMEGEQLPPKPSYTPCILIQKVKPQYIGGSYL